MSNRARRILGLSIGCLALVLPDAPRAQQQNADKALQLEQDIATLKRDVNLLARELDRISGQFNQRTHASSANSAPQRTPPPPPTTVDTHGELFRGSNGATIAIIEYSDFECPFCGQYEREAYPQIFDTYIKTGRVKLFFRNLPLPMHPHALAAARAAHCAGEQGKYWEMHDSLFAKQTALSDPALLDRAKTLGLDESRFSECFSSDKYSDELRKGMAEAQRLGIDGTPTFYIGTIDPSGDVVNISKRIVGANPYEVFQFALDEVLATKSQETISTY